MVPAVDPGAADRSIRVGVILGIVAAVGYSLANLALRSLSESGAVVGDAWDIWVTAVKAMVTGGTAWVIVLIRLIRGRQSFPSLALVPSLIVAGLVMQFGGNLCFQLALGHLGLAVTVPIVFACIIVVGALAGRAMLGDPITRDLVLAMGVMFAAIVLLSIGTMTDGPRIESVRVSGILTGLAIAAISGCSYGLVGVLIRYLVRSTLPVESVLIVFSTTGVLLLGGLAVSQAGWEPIQSASADCWRELFAASATNAIAFFAVSYALKVIDVNRMNVINASQNAMCAIGAVVIFDEQLNRLAITGIFLTIVGLLVLGRKSPVE